MRGSAIRVPQRGADKPTRPARRLSLPIRRGGSGQSFQFIRDTVAELKKVVWPSRQLTTRLATIVVVTSVGMGVLLGAVDWAFSQIMERFFLSTPPV